MDIIASDALSGANSGHSGKGPLDIFATEWRKDIYMKCISRHIAYITNIIHIILVTRYREDWCVEALFKYSISKKTRNILE